ncbi:MAG: type II toxin-antitoxin system HicA family toxin [Methanomicrobiales archaeon]|nr:type II toxin-antitoxin system HicA family toxin [Methanomicrobiales archaeon]
MIKLLARQGFEIRRQTSSHIVVQKEWRVFAVPLHKELKKEPLWQF